MSVAVVRLAEAVECKIVKARQRLSDISIGPDYAQETHHTLTEWLAEANDRLCSLMTQVQLCA